MNITSFIALRHALSQLPAADESARAEAAKRQGQLTKPAGSLGRLEDIAIFLAGWQRRAMPVITHPRALVFAGNHGVAAQGVSAYPSDVTVQMVANFNAGGAAINQLCNLHHIPFSAVALSLDVPTHDFTKEAAMNEEECVAAFTQGMRAVPKECDLLIVGEMGIGNTTSASAITCALLNVAPHDAAGPGTGLEVEEIAHKAAVIQKGLSHHAGHLADPFEVLRRLGGREISALAGAIAAARLQRTPVLLDGFVTAAATAILHAHAPELTAHCIAGHRSAEPAHALLLKYFALEPLLALHMRLGEGSGAAVAYGIVQAALATHAGMATFDSAQVSTKK